jgi:hypothetical protein
VKNYKHFLPIILALFLGSAAFHAQQPRKQTVFPAQTELEQKRIEHSKLYQKYTGIGDLRSAAAKSNGDVEVLSGAGQKIFFPNDPPTQLSDFVATMAHRADLIVIGKVNDQKSFLTEQGTFVFTDYTFTVEQVLKNNPNALLQPSGGIVVTRPGGIIQLNGRNIKASDESLASFETGKHYLLFLNYIPTTGAYKAFDSGGAFRINGSKTAKLTREQLPAELENGAELTVLMAFVQAALR